MKNAAIHYWFDWIWLTAEANDRCLNAHAFTYFIHKMGFLFLHLMHSRYKDKHLLNHKLNSSIANPAFHFQMAPTPKKQPFTFVVQFHILTDLLQQSHLSRTAQAMFRIPCFWQIPTSPLNKLHFFSSLKLHWQDYRIKSNTKNTRDD